MINDALFVAAITLAGLVGLMPILARLALIEVVDF